MNKQPSPEKTPAKSRTMRLQKFHKKQEVLYCKKRQVDVAMIAMEM